MSEGLEEITLKIEGYDDRAELCSLLCANGYKTWVKETDNYPWGKQYFVVFEVSIQDMKRNLEGE